ncbi:MAG: putative DNA binding domain-containing protein [Saprospiraceae bacterium]|nr:putative DNA binding domain-containing protein [Saprospiraceae bacterium]
MTIQELHTLVARLLSAQKENEFIEFKESNFNKEMIGERISALANGASLLSQPYGYLLFGIEDVSRQVVGTSFKPSNEKVGNEELEHWLTQRLSPKVDYRIYEFDYQGKPLVLFHIPAAYDQPISFQHTPFIRVGSLTRKLKDFPEKERKLWQRPAAEFEKEVALSRVSAADVVALLDTQSVFDLLLKIPYPTTRAGVIEKLAAEKLIIRSNGHYDITNLGALLFAKKMNSFDTISRKAVRVVQYEGINKLKTLKDQTGSKGYANGFEGLMQYISGLLPSNEVIGMALRKEIQMYPPLAVRELVVNALIHQDFRERGTGVLVEIYSDRIEINNPGNPMINPDRFIDEFQSRNETLAAIMRRIGLCEEVGSGIDKVILNAEVWQLPAPDFQVKETHTKAILYAHRSLRDMNKADKVRACYQHCALQYVTKSRMTNQSLRKRFDIDEQNYSIASRIIRDTMKENLIKLEDPDNKSKKLMSYIPFWA